MSVERISEGAIVRQRPAVESVDLDGESVIYDPATGDLHRLNTTASLVWNRCDGSETVGQLVQSLQSRFTGPGGEIADDVGSVISRLAALSLVEIDTN